MKQRDISGGEQRTFDVWVTFEFKGELEVGDAMLFEGVVVLQFGALLGRGDSGHKSSQRHSQCTQKLVLEWCEIPGIGYP